MTDIPIIFSAPMVKALLAGHKTMTRRLAHRKVMDKLAGELFDAPSPWQRVKVGDRLWVRENLCKRQGNFLGIKQNVFEPHYAADDAEVLNEHEFNCVWVWKGKSLPSIHMPRWASRLTLVVTATKIEPIKKISFDDIRAEGLKLANQGGVLYGVFGDRWTSPRNAFRLLWSSLHGADSWDANPEVVALSFAVHKQNIDAMKEAA